MTHPQFWSAEQDATLLRMWGAGASGSEIARAIGGGRTRNACIARIHRIKDREYRKGASEPKRINQSKPAKAPKPMPAPPPPPQPRPQAMGLDIMELTSSSCRWIHPDGTYCGATVKEGSSYCSHHHAICYQPVPPRVDRAIRHVAGVR